MRESCQCEIPVLYSLVLEWEMQREATLMSTALGSTAWFGCLCVNAACVVCGLCTCSRLCDSNNPSALMSACMCVCVCGNEAVYMFCCAVKLHFNCFFLTCVVFLGNFSPCCNISLPHWKTQIFEFRPAALWSLSQYWLMLLLNTSKPQGKARQVLLQWVNTKLKWNNL